MAKNREGFYYCAVHRWIADTLDCKQCPECRKIYNKKYREQHRERLIELKRQWDKDNKEHRQQYSKEYNSKRDKEAHNAQKRKRYHDNPRVRQQISEYAKRPEIRAKIRKRGLRENMTQEQVERKNTTLRQWRANNKDRHDESMKRHLQRRKEWSCNHDIDAAKLSNIWLQASGCCYYCGQRVNKPRFNSDVLNTRGFDNKIPLCKGGTHSVENLVVCCRQCNIAKGTAILDTDDKLERFRLKMKNKGVIK